VFAQVFSFRAELQLISRVARLSFLHLPRRNVTSVKIDNSLNIGTCANPIDDKKLSFWLRKRTNVKRKCLAPLLFMLFGFAGAPVLANDLSFGQFNQGVYSGSAPFNTTGNCTDPGDDCADTDLRIRSADIISYAWSIAASGIPAGDPDFDAVVLVQTITPGANAEVIFDEIPTVCLAPPFGPGGTTVKPNQQSRWICHIIM